jgi:hypothetical protein
VTATRNCARCGAALAGDLPCARCLLRTAVEVGEDEAHAGSRRLRTPTIAELQPYFEHLEIVSRLGSGGTGVVFAARERASGREVALKVLTIRGEGEAFDERFAREARATAALQHPNIVSVEEFGRAGPDDAPWSYLLMDQVDGRDLRRTLREGRVAAETALRWLEEICGALAYAHERGVIHRDIKPENVLIDGTGRAQVVDFGLAKLLAEDAAFPTRTGQGLGTYPYLAPEQYETPGKVDRRADVYSLGVLAYELLTGRQPVGNFERPSRLARLGPGVDALVLKALARDPEKRFASATEMRRELQRLGGRARPKRRGPLATPQRYAKHFLAFGAVAYVVGAVTFVSSLGSGNPAAAVFGAFVTWIALADVAAGIGFAIWSAFERSDEGRGAVGAVQPTEPWARIAIAAVVGLAVAAVLAFLIAVVGVASMWGAAFEATFHLGAPPSLILR